MKAATRNSNHELLWIIAMYMIVLIHANMYLGDFCTGTAGSFTGFIPVVTVYFFYADILRNLSLYWNRKNCKGVCFAF